MSRQRLSLAREAGLFDPSRGRIVVFGAREIEQIADLPVDRTVVVSTLRPVHDVLTEAGFTVVRTAPDAADLAIVILPRSKALGRAWLSEACRLSSGPVVVDGQKSDGVEGMLRALRKQFGLGVSLSKDHGKIAALPAGADLSDWADPGLVPVGDGFVTQAGVFSADGPDPGSQLLARALPDGLGPRVAELGAGWGYLARAILDRDGVSDLHLVEADDRALDCARANVTDDRARFHWQDATRFSDPQGFDDVVMNPPFHASRAGDPSLGVAFLEAAARLLRRSGKLWLVANRHLPYEKALAERFADVVEIGGDRSYKLVRASRPVRKRG